ncbi:MAG: response regulator [Proteobacteria bacterium]|nr:response regulator [Pseudomonadota bacterium]MBU1715259.1 response regulator [Pseudomonadota bacterium]
MDLFKDFTQKDMIEQIVLLEDLKDAKQVDALPALFDLYANPNPDQAVDEMVYHAIYQLLAGIDEQIVNGLRHQSDRVRLLCVCRSRDGKAVSAKPVLLEMLKTVKNPEMLSEVIHALIGYKDPELLAELLPFIDHEDVSVVVWALKGLGATGDARARDVMIERVNQSSCLKNASGECELRTALVVENLALFKDEVSIAFLVAHIHNANPMFRRVILSALISTGSASLLALEKVLESGEQDEKIMAANVIGFIGDKQGADLLLAHLEEVADLNLKFAIYEALGRIMSMRSVIGLTDGLAEHDQMVLTAVITGLDNLFNPGVFKVLLNLLNQADTQSDLILKVVIMARATNIFTAIYKEGNHAERLITAVVAGGGEAMAFFSNVLSRIDTDRKEADLVRLSKVEAGKTAARRVLAADDSKAMLFFYKGGAAELGVDMVTALDGKEAFSLLEKGDKVDLLVTDMNMPNMDGIELTKKIRAIDEWKDLPILMASTESEKTQKEVAMQAGVNDFITKPFTMEQFKAKVESMFL